MKHYALIPARNGSKSIINKNLRKIGNLSLIEKAIHSARQANIFEKIIISTDIPSILEDYSGEKKVHLIARKQELCQDNSRMKDVVLDTIELFNFEKDSWLWLLQPTSPFRKQEDFKSMLDIITNTKAKSIISTKSVGANHPNRMYTRKGDFNPKYNILYPLRYTNFNNKQELKDNMVIRNGCFYVFNVDSFKKEKSFYIKPCFDYLMNDMCSINIDTQLDLEIARFVGGSL